MHRHLHTSGMAVANLDIAVDHHVLADKPHRAHTDGIAKLLQLIFQRGNLRIAVTISDCAQTGGTLAKVEPLGIRIA